jgi:hypothetical protein
MAEHKVQMPPAYPRINQLDCFSSSQKNFFVTHRQGLCRFVLVRFSLTLFNLQGALGVLCGPFCIAMRSNAPD